MSYRVHIDFEGRSVAELARQNAVGEHAYAAHPSTDATLLAVNSEGGNLGTTVQELLKNNKVSEAVRAGIADGATFVAHNARFEQAIWYWQMHLRFGWPLIQNWSCTAARARYWGLRASLDGCSSDLETVNRKDKRGDALIKLFCKPRLRKKNKLTGLMSIVKPWATPEEEPEKWQEFIQYCADDVNTEMEVDSLLPDLPEFEQAAWNLDYTMNWRGVPIDLPMVHRAIEFCDHFTNQAVKRFEKITGGLRPTQRDKVLAYVNQREMELENLRSKTLKRINLVELEPELRECVQIRLDTAMASVKKLQAMVRCTTGDGLARGLVLYYGAHTGRDSGKRIQPQNFKRGNKWLQRAIFDFLPTMERDSSWKDTAALIFPNPLSALAHSMKGFIKAPEGERFVVADYAQIEARVLAWLAGAESKLEAFRNKDDLYVRFASIMYGHSYDSFFDANGKLLAEYAFQRQVAKSAELGCGFGLGGPKFVEYCDNSDIIIDEDTAKATVKAWRKNNPEIVKYWERVEKAAKLAVANEGKTYYVGSEKRVAFKIHRIDEARYWLLCIPPSGRHAAYYRPKLRDGLKWGKVPVTILSFRAEWNGKSYREDTYGGKLVENIVQGTARDIMKVGVQNAENAGYKFILPVHDEGIFTRPIGEGSHEELERLMCDLPAVYAGLPVTAEGHECDRYTK